MTEVLVRALFGFDDNVYGSVRRGQELPVTEHAAAQLERNGCVKRISKRSAPRPQQAGGARSSASPAAPASPQTTANSSDSGGMASAGQGNKQPETDGDKGLFSRLKRNRKRGKKASGRSSSSTQRTDSAPGQTRSTQWTEPGGENT